MEAIGILQASQAEVGDNKLDRALTMTGAV